MKKKYTVVKTKLFKQQEKRLPRTVRADLKKIMKNMVKDPHHLPGSMSVFGPPSAEELMQWMDKVHPDSVDLVLEYLVEKRCLTAKGNKLAGDFYKKYMVKKQ